MIESSYLRVDDLEELRLDDRVAIVTGAARGLGRAIAELLAGRGARVAMVDARDALLEEAAGEIRARGLDAAARPGDVADPVTARRVVGACLETWGRLDILVNNAAIGGRHAPLWEIGDEEWQSMLAVNAGGVFYFCRAAVPALRERGWGRIVNIASSAAKEPVALTSHYSSSKAAVVALTKVLAREVAGFGILVNAVAPGAFDTEMRRRPGVSAELFADVGARIPLGRLGRPVEVARLVAFLASPQLTYSTGAVFDISGGITSY